MLVIGQWALSANGQMLRSLDSPHYPLISPNLCYMPSLLILFPGRSQTHPQLPNTVPLPPQPPALYSFQHASASFPDSNNRPSLWLHLSLVYLLSNTSSPGHASPSVFLSDILPQLSRSRPMFPDDCCLLKVSVSHTQCVTYLPSALPIIPVQSLLCPNDLIVFVPSPGASS